MKELLFPLLTVNEPEALLIRLQVAENQSVRKGDPLYTLETTKSTTEVIADSDGIIVELGVQEGQTIQAGKRFACLAESAEEAQQANLARPVNDSIRDEADRQPTPTAEVEIPSGLRITKPALNLARQYRIDLDQLPQNAIVTEHMIRNLLEEKPDQIDYSPPEGVFDPMALVVYGGGGHGKSVIELARSLGSYTIVGVIDDGIPAGGTILGVPILGGQEILSEISLQGVRLAVNAVGGIGNSAIRVQVFKRLAQAGFGCPAMVHPTAFVEPSAHLSAGVQIFPHAYIGSESKIGFGSIINTGAIVSHDCELGHFVNISPGAILAGEVQVGKGALIGMGATINLRTKIGDRARIGNNATVKSDVPASGIVRAGRIWPE